MSEIKFHYEYLKHSNLRSELKWRLIGILGKWFIDLLFFTIQIKYRNRDRVCDLINSKRFIFAFWHSRILPVAYTHKGYGAAIMVSQSEDGEIIAQVIHRQGHEPVRGSSSKGGREALDQIRMALEKNIRPGVIIPDGPQGPRFKVQHGIINLAKKTGYPIIPITASFKKMKVFSSWDRFVLPYPFTKCLVIYGKPIYAPNNSDKNKLEGLRKELEDEMNLILKEADNAFGHKFV